MLLPRRRPARPAEIYPTRRLHARRRARPGPRRTGHRAARGRSRGPHGKTSGATPGPDVARPLAARGFRVVVPDQLGFGRSSKPDVHYTFELLARLTARVLDEVGVGEVAVVGHSIGGMLKVRFALMFPARVTHLVCSRTPSGSRTTGGGPLPVGGRVVPRAALPDGRGPAPLLPELLRALDRGVRRPAAGPGAAARRGRGTAGRARRRSPTT